MSSLSDLVNEGTILRLWFTADPDPSQYVWDDQTGYYYDHSTGLYYDANSQVCTVSITASCKIYSLATLIVRRA